jgi:hypothetical protein
MAAFGTTRYSQEFSGTADCLWQSQTCTWYMIRSSPSIYCSVCDKEPADGRSPDWLCRRCAELQRWLPRKLRHNLEALRAALDDFDKIMRKVRCSFQSAELRLEIFDPTGPHTSQVDPHSPQTTTSASEAGQDTLAASRQITASQSHQTQI